MSPIGALIRKLCPDGAPMRTLGEVGTFTRGGGFQKGDLTDEGAPAIHYGQIHTHYGTAATETISFLPEHLAARIRKAEPGDLVIVTTSEDDEAVGKAVAWLGIVGAAVSGDAYIYRHSLDPKYAAYFFQSRRFQEEKMRSITGTKVRRISGDNLAKITIPVPPLEVQREIASTLDSLSKLTAGLEAGLTDELRKRQAQYGYYRDAILGKEVRRARLGELADFKYGFTASAALAGDYRFVRITDITPSGKLSPNDAKYLADSVAVRDYLLQPDDLLVARTGATYGKTLLVSTDEPAVYASFLIRVRFRGATILPAFYWHFAQSSLYWSQAKAMVSTGGQPQFNANVLKLVEVPVPPIREQERVVALLDEFDASVDELKERLLSEQKCRRRQYEYHRDRLLAFESSRKSAAGAMG